MLDVRGKLDAVRWNARERKRKRTGPRVTTIGGTYEDKELDGGEATSIGDGFMRKPSPVLCCTCNHTDALVVAAYPKRKRGQPGGGVRHCIQTSQVVVKVSRNTQPRTCSIESVKGRPNFHDP